MERVCRRAFDSISCSILPSFVDLRSIEAQSVPDIRRSRSPATTTIFSVRSASIATNYENPPEAFVWSITPSDSTG